MDHKMQQERDFRWFLEHYNELYEQHGKSFLAIENEKVIGEYDSYAEAVHKVSEHIPVGSFIVQKCDGSEAAYTNYISTVCLS